MSASPSNSNWLESRLAAISGVKVTVFGDFCLDAYWLIDADETEVSVETGLPVRRVREQRYSLGGAGNIAANLVALGVGEVRAVGLIGDDLFGRQLLQLLADLGVDCEGMLRTQADWQTLVYSKPCIGDEELNRMDFGSFSTLAPETLDGLADQLELAAARSDAVVLNQQVPAGVSTPAMIERINAVAAAHPDRLFIADSRHRAELYSGCAMKLNAHEASRLFGRPIPYDERVTADQAGTFAGALFERTRKPVFVTRGENGLIAVDESGLHEVPGIQILERVDPVGAGDTLVSAIAAVLASGGDVRTAAKLANIAASVTVRKFQTTGTATPDEIRAVGNCPARSTFGTPSSTTTAQSPRSGRAGSGSWPP